MITSKQQGSLLPLTSDQQARVLRHVERILSARCPHCCKQLPPRGNRLGKKFVSSREYIAVWGMRSDGAAGGWICTHCGESGYWHKDQTLEEIGLMKHTLSMAGF